MTMFERLERLEARIGELEARLLKPETATRDPADRWPSEDAPVVNVSGNAAYPWTALSQSVAPRSPEVEAVERGLIAPPPPYEVRLLKEACELLQRWKPCVRYLDLDSDLDARTDSLLARARCTEGTANVRPTTR